MRSGGDWEVRGKVEEAMGKFIRESRGNKGRGSR